MSTTSMKRTLHEDWIAVVLAALSLIVISAGVKPTLPKFEWSDASSLMAQLTNIQNWTHLGVLYIWLCAALAITRLLSSQPAGYHMYSGALFPVIVMFVSQVITGNKGVSGFGIEIVLFSLLLGLFISNVLKVPGWLKPAIQTELYIKTGLVILGSTIIFGDIMKAGALGIIQSVVVVFTVWYFSFWLCKKLGLDDEFRMMISSAVSICGVSAAIATSGAIEGDNKKLSQVISLVLIVAIPMMLLMPPIAHWMGMSPAVTGAWLGGTIDTSGAVVAAGTLAGEEAFKIATIVKFSQNVLLGLAAFGISVYWAYTKKQDNAQKPGIHTIWERFPKFVLGFIVASLIFSFLVPAATFKDLKAPIKDLQTFFFALAFVCIGLETKFKDIFGAGNSRPALAFIIAQVFNIFFTLIIAYLVFGGWLGLDIK
ncbi:YeiH family protein [Chitinophaga sedimenti]|uniref:YeiH family protein n=1 Tax=Chitinophaga sedimenti TaxID=2033606 RepID=UPI002004A40A|nr:putative sulfate exporter family transporter [Chitinophaga sedimenti]MCK7555254.1 YeiH family protein [Chitinophaga sedimenti]